jgi:signal peptidase I
MPQRLWDKFWYGRSHVDWVAKEDDFIILDEKHFYGKTHFIFFPRTYLITKNGHKYSAPGTDSRIQALLNRNLNQNSFSRVIAVKKGDTIAKGFVDTGDQLVVNKFVYHWKKPKRGEVFVFNTQDIRGIQMGLDPRQGSQHYIKRMGGQPGDKLEVQTPKLLINGEEAKEAGFQRVMSQEGLYTGYTRDGSRLSVELKDGEYWALGDNSANSSDSRMWGIVPEKNIVGRAAFVYYPFGHHFGGVD